MKTYRFFLFATLALTPFYAAMAAPAPASQEYVAILENRLQLLEQQVQTLTNQTEQAQYQARTAQERLARMEEDNTTRFRMLEDKLADAAAAAPAAAPAAQSVEAEATKAAAQAAAGASLDEQKMGALTAAEDDQPSDPNVAYDKAFAQVKAGDYDAAIDSLRAFIKKWPEHELASNASYWLGESFYARKEYTTALKTFAEGFQKYPKGSKAEDTLMKLGITLTALDRPKDACTAFAKLESSFPRMGSKNRRVMMETRTRLQCGAARPAAAEQ